MAINNLISILWCLLTAQILHVVIATGLWDLLPLNLGDQQVREPTISDYASQGLGLLNYFSNIRPAKNLDVRAKDSNFLGIPGIQGVPDLPGLPNIPLLKGVPAVPGLSGAIPGVGACLPKGTPLVNPASPSIFQDLLRNIPGAHDLLKSLHRPPKIEPGRLIGKWYWVITTPSAQNRYCAISEYSGLTTPNSTTASFSVFDSYRENAPHGASKFGFGYGLVLEDQVSIYTQTDPCPYEVVAVGRNDTEGQYDYILLSNWAKYPVIGLTRDLDHFFTVQKSEVETFLKNNGYTNFFTDLAASVSVADWTYCNQKPVNVGNIAADIVHGILFGKKRRR